MRKAPKFCLLRVQVCSMFPIHIGKPLNIGPKHSAHACEMCEYCAMP